jgi:hypothetical protein
MKVNIDWKDWFMIYAVKAKRNDPKYMKKFYVELPDNFAKEYFATKEAFENMTDKLERIVDTHIKGEKQ